MAGGEIGRLKVRVLPDTTHFRRDLKKALDRIERTAQVEVKAKLADGTVARLRQQLESIRATVDVDIDTDARAMREKVRTTAESVREDVKVGVNLQRGTFYAQLATLLRPRELDVHARLRTGRALGALGALSGMNTMRRVSGEFLDTVRNLDQTMPRLARSATILGTAAAGALAGTSNLLGIASGIVGIVPILLPVPAVLAAVAGGMAIVTTAMADAGDYIGDLSEQWSGLRDIMSHSFWATAEGGIRRFTAAFVPLANQWIPRVANGLGELTGAIASAFEAPRGSANLEKFFSNFAGMLSMMREGMTSMSSGLLELVGAGSTYLPRLGAAFSDVMGRFNAWLTAAVDSGRFFDWVDAAIVNFRALLGVIGGLSGILSALSTAALAADAATLTDFAAALDRVHKALDGPAWQKALTTVFAGAHQAMRNLAPAAFALGAAFLALAPTLARLMDLTGQIANVALVALAKALQNPAFQKGLGSFFEGVLAGAQGFAPAFELIAEKLGSILTLAGVFAANFGPLLAGALEAFAPVIDAITTAMGALIPILTDQLASAISVIAPIIVGIVTTFSEWVKANPQLASTLLIAAAAIGGVIAVLVPIIGAISGVVTAVMSLGAVFTSAPLWIAAAVAAIVVILAGLLAAVIANWDAISTWWVEGWASIGQQWTSFWSDFTANTAAKIADFAVVIGSIPQLVSGLFASAGSWLIGAGRNVVQGLLDGAGQLLPQIGAFFLNKLPGWIQEPFKLALGIHSPSRVFAGYGENIGQGAINGIAKMAGAVRRSTQGLANAAMSGFDTASFVDPLGLEAEAKRAQAAMGRLHAAPPTAHLQIDSEVAIEEERKYQAAALGDALTSSLAGMSINLDGRQTIGAFQQSRSWPGRR